MTTFQKTVKYLAMAFALSLAITILSAIITAIFSVIGAFGFLSFNYGNDNIKSTYSMQVEKGTVIDTLDIDIDIADLKVIEGDTFKVEASNVSEKFKAEEVNNSLIIKEKGKTTSNLLFGNGTPKVTVYIPKNTVFKKATIETGVGKTTIDYLMSNEAKIKSGIGEFTIDNITINSKVQISGGVGKISINNSKLNNLKLETGVGETNISGEITGNSTIKCGVGAVKIDIVGSRLDYNVNTESGIGKVSVNDISKKESENKTPINDIKLEGGIGEMKLNFI